LTFKEKLRLLGRSLLLILLIRAVFAVFILIEQLLNLDYIEKLLDSDTSLVDLYGLPVALLLIIVVGPVVEEFSFRGWFSEIDLLVFCSLTIAVFYFTLIAFNILLPGYGYTKYLIVALVSLVPGYLIWIKKEKITRIIAVNKKPLIMVSVVCFAIVHALNFEINSGDWREWTALTTILLPYMASAVVLTRLRIKAGLAWSISLHIISNSFVILPLWLTN
jgi:membrane protease YdiL (CAAX protease family)